MPSPLMVWAFYCWVSTVAAVGVGFSIGIGIRIAKALEMFVDTYVAINGGFDKR